MSVETSVLARSKLFAGLGSDTANRLLKLADIIRFEPRVFIIREGQRADAFFCVVRGYVRLFKTNEIGRAADIRICEPRDTFAECLIGGGGIYAYNVQAADNVVLARFAIDGVRRLAEEDRALDRNIMRLMADHLLATMECVASDRLRTSSQRVANYLLSQCSAGNPSQTFRLPYQKSLLAGKLGLAPEALSRAFGALKEAGVTVRGRTVRIDDIAALRQM
ncbi:Crp family transcriptional regulator protein (plasmid) [Rhizobium etli 8C-3]|uniref:Crp family transcriptional regulator protein n=2 Tax=Rhizobium TaxID=379 RepID=A0A1L5PFC8_RHIET|nr:helix-turn-helix domain-containing protein [Rhizobium etli]APO78835.1 Crp family transcriptional regulator protein [Rhizobium etli 8C-3]TCU39160.1 CRP-like cAMP-binding protein [Rhizobium azibense]